MTLQGLRRKDASFTTNGQPGDVQGGPVALADLTGGLVMGDVAPGDQRTVVVSLVLDAPQGQAIFLQPV